MSVHEAAAERAFLLADAEATRAVDERMEILFDLAAARIRGEDEARTSGSEMGRFRRRWCGKWKT